LQPVAFALDELQGQNDVYLGHVLPDSYKLDDMLQKALKHSESLVKALLEGMDRRFHKELSVSSADKIIAAISRPFLNYAGCQMTEEINVVKCSQKL